MKRTTRLRITHAAIQALVYAAERIAKWGGVPSDRADDSAPRERLIEVEVRVERDERWN